MRLQWCQARSMWYVTDWQKVVFSDESQFVLGTEDNRGRVWRCPGERYNSPHTVLRHTARTAGVMVWGAIAYDCRSTLIMMRGTLTGQRYVDDILRPHVGPFLKGQPGAIFLQDNARPHTARVSQDFLRHFQALTWLARSPDLSPVEHVWDQLKRQFPSCHSVHDLEFTVQDLWAHLPQDKISSGGGKGKTPPKAARIRHPKIPPLKYAARGEESLQQGVTNKQKFQSTVSRPRPDGVRGGGIPDGKGADKSSPYVFETNGRNIFNTIS
ncbi:transposable element Tcb2 transposase [Trichonephila clavipes]|uniref:Transposable element Tcb2 transposase n=1 Tax=Trichonephila clavipes TaxID=2585209 RepID=A0A8X6RV87_TRICX|nr:transposable element Tcb2 transposase [Trichonephila clavipes]